MNTYAEIKIKSRKSENLATRESADSFFNTIEKLRAEKIIVNFSGVTFMSRSFAHQYLTREKESNKQITNTHEPKEVKKMLELVKESKNAPAIHFNTGRIAALHL